MASRRPLATLSLVVGVAATHGACAAPAGQQEPLQEPPATDQPLDITVDSLDVVHGALRISATMVDGAADVSVQLGGSCEHREIGGGVSTLSSLVWSLGDRDIARAIGCGLAVRVRVRDDGRYVNKLAELAVTIDLAGQEADGTGHGPRLQSVVASAAMVRLVFAPVTPGGSRLITCGSVLEAAPMGAENDDPPPGDETGQFFVPSVEFARAILRDRPFYLDGSSFAASLTVGGVQADARQPAEPTEPDDEG